MFLKAADWLKGSGKHSISVPVMDGALKPNDALDAADEIYRGVEPDNLVVSGSAVHFSIGNKILRFDAEKVPRASSIGEFSANVSCLAAFDDQLAVGLEVGEVRILGGRFDGAIFNQTGDRSIKAPVALRFENGQTLLLALGSQNHPPSGWKRDLMEGNASGSVWRIDLASGRSTLLGNHLAFPYGIEVVPGGAILVSESWKHRIVDISDVQPRVVVDDLPFYPARLTMTSTGDILVCGFAPRRQLVEFILREHQFVQRMMSDIPEQYWMAPALSSGMDYWEPLQQGQIRHHGILKRWSPTRSYGLVATMDVSGRFLRSIHCRSGGDRHGITSAIEYGSQLIMTSKGGGVVLAAQAQEA